MYPKRWPVTQPATISSHFLFQMSTGRQQYWWIHLLIQARMLMHASFHLSSSLSSFYRLCGIDCLFAPGRDWKRRERRRPTFVHYYFSQSGRGERSLGSCDHTLAEATYSESKPRVVVRPPLHLKFGVFYMTGNSGQTGLPAVCWRGDWSGWRWSQQDIRETKKKETWC